MAKQKTKKSVFDTTVTEVSFNNWVWHTDDNSTWLFKDGQPGCNLFFTNIAGTTLPQGFFKTLEGAVYYSWGYHYGRKKAYGQ